MTTKHYQRACLPAVPRVLPKEVSDTAKQIEEMVSTRGFEPPTPGFIPLRLSPPLSRSWSGLSLHRKHVAVRCRPSSLYTLPRISPGLGSGLAYRKTSEAFPDFERFDQTSFLVRPPIHRNPVLYPAELRGLTGECENWISYPHEGGNRKIETGRRANATPKIAESFLQQSREGPFEPSLHI